MRLKKFNEMYESIDENLKQHILEYLKEHYSEEWWSQQKSERAIEYDILEDIAKDLMNKFNISEKDYYSNSGVSDVVNDYMIDTISWYDTNVFHKSDFNPNQNYLDLKKHFDNI